MKKSEDRFGMEINMLNLFKLTKIQKYTLYFSKPLHGNNLINSYEHFMISCRAGGGGGGGGTTRLK